MLQPSSIRHLLDERLIFYNTPAFIAGDPVSVPHRFSKPQDIEIAGFFAAILAWGARTTIINNCLRLMRWMDEDPYDFILHHRPEDLKPMLGFVHRTFNATDLLYFIFRLQLHYRAYESLESAFTGGAPSLYEEADTGPALIRFHHYFFAPEHPERTRKHVSTPARGSACKRLCMYLRWMVRCDAQGVDFGLWKAIAPAQLVCPLDVHVARVAHRLGLTTRATADWRSALELTGVLRQWRPGDPAAYDFALFGLGAEERF